jgi:hypothetical protein
MPCYFSWTNADGSFDLVQLDVYDSETHGFATEVTDFPVEDGPNISDNVRRKPKTLAIEGYVSDTPLPQNGRATNAGAVYAELGPHTLNLPGSTHFHNQLQTLDVPSSPLRPNLQALASAGFSALAGALGFGGPPQINARVQDPRKSETATAQIWTWPSWTSRAGEAFRLLEKAYDTAVLMKVVTDFKTYDGMVFADNGLQVPRKVEDGAGAPFSLSLKQVRIVNSKTVTAPKPAETSGQLKKSAGSKAGKDEPADHKKQRDTILAALLGLAKPS